MQSPLTVGMRQVPDHRIVSAGYRVKALLLVFPSLQTLVETFQGPEGKVGPQLPVQGSGGNARLMGCSTSIYTCISPLRSKCYC